MCCDRGCRGAQRWSICESRGALSEISVTSSAERLRTGMPLAAPGLDPFIFDHPLEKHNDDDKLRTTASLDGSHLAVTNISDGLIAKWNNHHQKLKVRVGDRILAVSSTNNLSKIGQSLVPLLSGGTSWQMRL